MQKLDETINALRQAGTRLLSGPVLTPWGHLNARLEAPDGMQVTLFHIPSDSSEEAKEVM